MAPRIRNVINRDGRYYARIVVPRELRPYIGKTELRTPLGSDYVRALRVHHVEVGKLQMQLAEAEKQRRMAEGLAPTLPRFELSPDEIGIAHYREELARDEIIRATNPALASIGIDDTHVANLRRAIAGHADADELESTIGDQIRNYQRRGNTSVVIGSPEWRALARILATAELEAIRAIAERDQGQTPSPPAAPFLEKVNDATRPPLRIDRLFDNYFRELKHAGGKGDAAHQRWSPVFDELRRFLHHNDAHKVTRADILRFKDEKLKTLAPRTVRDVYVAAIRAIFGWAESNDLIDANPADKVKVRVPKAVRIREKGFTDSEALAILKHCLAYEPADTGNPRTTETAPMTAAKKWAPWLCAFTGARVSEITQLRKQDVRRDGDINYLRITPDAGSVKTGEYRDVPIHPQLIDLGFLDFVNASAEGPLFFTGTNKAGARTASRTVSDRIGKWLRACDLVPDGVSPNHGWRHRFKTISLELGLNNRVIDAIQGHAARTAGESYGDVTLRTKQRAIVEFSYFAVHQQG